MRRRRLHGKVMEAGIEDRQGGQAGVFITFSFHGGVESYLQSYPLQSYHK